MAQLEIRDNEPRVQYSVGSSTTGPFSIPFAFFQKKDINVIKTKNGTDTVLSSSDYSISGTVTDAGFYQDGDLTLNNAVSNCTLTIYRKTVIERTDDFPQQGPFNIQALNTTLDKLYAISQELETGIQRSATLTKTDTRSDVILPPVKNGRALVWENGSLVNGDAFAGTGLAFIQTFSDKTADADPGSGTLRLNNATQNQATEAYVDDKDQDGTDISTLVGSIGNTNNGVKGHLSLRSRVDSTKWLVFRVDGATDASGYEKLTLVNVDASVSSPFSDGDTVVVGFVRAGESGAAGDTSIRENGSLVATEPYVNITTGLDATHNSNNNEVNVLLDTGHPRNADHSAITISAGTGLTGGGNINASRTLDLDTANTRNADHSAITVTGGTGLAGGGDLTASRMISLDIAGLNSLGAAPANADLIGIYDSSAGSHKEIDVSELKSAFAKSDVGLGSVPNEDATDPYNLDQRGATDGDVLTWDNGNGRWQPESAQGDAQSSGTTRTISSDLALTSSDAYAQHIKADASGLTVSLPDATTLSKGLAFEIYNRGQTGNTFALDAGGGNPLITGLGAQEGVLCHLHDNGTTAGVWSIPNVKDVTLASGKASSVKEIATDTPNRAQASVEIDDKFVIVMWEDGNNEASFRAVDYSTDPPTLKGTELVLSGESLRQDSRPRLAPVSTTEAVAVTEGGISLIEWTGSDLQRSDGPKTFTTSSFRSPAVTKRNDGRFLVVYADSSNDDLEAVVYTVSSGTISEDIATTALDTGTSYGGTEISVTPFDNTFDFVLYSPDNGSNMNARLVKISGGSISSPDVLTNIQTNGNSVGGAEAEKLSTTSVVGAYVDSSPTNNRIEVAGFTLDSGNETISRYDTHVINPSDSVNDPYLVKVDQDTVIIVYDEGGSPADVVGDLLSADGSSVSADLELFKNSTDISPLAVAEAVNSIYFLPIIGNDNGNNNYISAVLFEVSALKV